jgi:Glycosyltransferase family 87
MADPARCGLHGGCGGRLCPPTDTGCVSVSAEPSAAGSPPADAALPRSVSRRGLLRAMPLAVRDTTYVLVVLFSLLLAIFWILLALRNETFGFDFRGTLWDAAIAIRDGRSPYPQPVESEVDVGNPALYPPFLMLLVVPLTFLPWWLGLTIWTLLQATAVLGALAVLRIRDVRCYALALLSIPVLQGLIWGNATLLLVPLVALAWRWRDHWARAGIVVGLAIASKLFAWPLLVYLLGTRRYRAAGTAAATTVVVIFVPWVAIGSDGLTAYPDLLRVAERFYSTHSFSLATVLAGLGLDPSVASRGSLGVGVAIAAAAFYAGRRHSEELSISLAILAAILGSPIAWEYYYVLLLVPVAILRPRFSGLWMLLLLTYVAHMLPREHLPRVEFEPGGVACCKPAGIPMASWAFNHAPPALWPALGNVVLAVMTVVLVAWTQRSRQVTPHE